MNWQRMLSHLKKDGWLLAALLLCVAVCLGLGLAGETEDTAEGRISRVLSSMDGAGHVELAVYYESSIPCGAVVVADG
ncbi:MAG: hypothetical protein IJZ74_09520, partial [Clostridia bacterium]|nr:hypothetical protein [Clostridia bacterium]